MRLAASDSTVLVAIAQSKRLSKTKRKAFLRKASPEAQKIGQYYLTGDSSKLSELEKEFADSFRSKLARVKGYRSDRKSFSGPSVGNILKGSLPETQQVNSFVEG